MLIIILIIENLNIIYSFYIFISVNHVDTKCKVCRQHGDMVQRLKRDNMKAIYCTTVGLEKIILAESCLNYCYTLSPASVLS